MTDNPRLRTQATPPSARSCASAAPARPLQRRDAARRAPWRPWLTAAGGGALLRGLLYITRTSHSEAFIVRGTGYNDGGALPRGAVLLHPAFLGAARAAMRRVLDGDAPTRELLLTKVRAAPAPPPFSSFITLLWPERRLYRVGPNCETWPNTLTENPY
jgi:hypothetical protein